MLQIKYLPCRIKASRDLHILGRVIPHSYNQIIIVLLIAIQTISTLRIKMHTYSTLALLLSVAMKSSLLSTIIIIIIQFHLRLSVGKPIEAKALYIKLNDLPTWLTASNDKRTKNNSNHKIHSQKNVVKPS
jgi:hypothetical protein